MTDDQMERLEDLLLYLEAEKRMAPPSSNSIRSEADVMASMGISEADLDSSDDVESD